MPFKPSKLSNLGKAGRKPRTAGGTGPAKPTRPARPARSAKSADEAKPAPAEKPAKPLRAPRPVAEKKSAPAPKTGKPETPEAKPARPVRGAKPPIEKKSAPAARTGKPETPAEAKPARAPKPATEKKSGPAARPGKPSARDPEAPIRPAADRRFINVYLGLGSNIGNRREHLREAIFHIERGIGKIARRSHLYETQPWGKTDQDAFLNQVIMVNTLLDPRVLLDKIADIEREMGRNRAEKWGPRTADIDILFYGKRIVRDRGLEIPHPELHKRAFVLIPMMEIAPELEHPLLKKPMDELYMECDDPSEVVRLDA